MIELPQVIRHNKDADKERRDEIIEEAEKELARIDDTLLKIHGFIAYIVSLGQMFEKERFQFKKTSRFCFPQRCKQIKE